jgi:hypothetical protein
MKKILIILIIVLVIIATTFFGWLLLRNPDVLTEEVDKNILPFGSGDSQPTTNDPQLTTGEGDQLRPDKFGIPTAKLFRVSDTPVAGAVILERGGEALVRYVDRATGHIYEASLTTLAKTRITNQTLPKIYEAYFRADGNMVLLRSLKDASDVVENFSLALTPPQSTSASTTSTSSLQITDGLYGVSSTAFRGDISAVSVGSGDTLFYALRNTSSIVSSTFNGTGAKTILVSPFKDWGLVANGGSLIVYTKASANATGYAYKLNTSNGALTKILGPLNGLVAIPSATGNKVIHSYTEGGRIRSFVKNLTNNTVSEILPSTLAEKCLWSTKNTGVLLCGAPTGSLGIGEPDLWYRGITHYSDSIWLFDTNTDTTRVLAEPEQLLGINLDIIDPKLSPKEDFLVFMNKTDMSLWTLKLE